MDDLLKEWERVNEEQNILDSLKGDILHDSLERLEQKREIEGAIYHIVYDYTMNDKNLQHHFIDEYIRVFGRISKELESYQKKTKLLSKEVVNIIKRMMDRIIERRKNLPPPVPSKPYLKLPEILADSFHPSDWSIFESAFMFDPLTEKYVNSPQAEPKASEQQVGAFRTDKDRV